MELLDFGFYNMDCMEGMKEFPDKYFDLAIVDPPYGGGSKDTFDGRFGNKGSLFERYHNIKAERTGGTWAKKYGKKISSWDNAPNEEYFAELFRVSKNQVIWGGNYFPLPPTRCFLVWKKLTISESFTMAMAEYAWTSFDSNSKVFEHAPQEHGRFHPTQKPVALYKWILNNYAERDDVILDTHAGSASSLVACHETGHKYVGFEIDAEYYSKAMARLEREEAQMNIFNMGSIPYQEG